MALMDIPNLARTFSNVWRVLATGGSFVFSITHPCFQTPGSRQIELENNAADAERAHEERSGAGRLVWEYFEEGFWRSDNPAGVRWRVGAHHRRLDTYINTLIDAGFLLERILEPRATGQLSARLPGYAVLPGVLLVRARK
jgi:hypothetical protein